MRWDTGLEDAHDKGEFLLNSDFFRGKVKIKLCFFFTFRGERWFDSQTVGFWVQGFWGALNWVHWTRDRVIQVVIEKKSGANAELFGEELVDTDEKSIGPNFIVFLGLYIYSPVIVS